MEKIEFIDAQEVAREKAQIADFCVRLTENLAKLKRFNKAQHVIDEKYIFEVSTARKSKDKQKVFEMIVCESNPFSGSYSAKEKAADILKVLTTTDLESRKVSHPQFGTLEPLASFSSSFEIAGREVRGSDFIIKNSKVSVTDDLLREIEAANTYQAENETQEDVYRLARSIAQNFQQLGILYAKNNGHLNRNMFLNQIFDLSSDTDFKIDEKNLFVSILPLFK